MTTYKELFNQDLDETVPVPQGLPYSLLLERGDEAAYYQEFQSFTDDASRFVCDTCGGTLTQKDIDDVEMDDSVTCRACNADD